MCVCFFLCFGVCERELSGLRKGEEGDFCSVFLMHFIF